MKVKTSKKQFIDYSGMTIKELRNMKRGNIIKVVKMGVMTIEKSGNTYKMTLPTGLIRICYNI
jgi:hypothetical protein